VLHCQDPKLSSIRQPGRAGQKEKIYGQTASGPYRVGARKKFDRQEGFYEETEKITDVGQLRAELSCKAAAAVLNCPSSPIKHTGCFFVGPARNNQLQNLCCGSG